MNAVKNARFWVWHNESWVKLTLVPDQTLSLHTGGPTEEGYSYTTETYTHEGDEVSCEITTHSLDCDGRYDWFNSVRCPLSELRAEPSGHYQFDENDKPVLVDHCEGVFRPNWEKVGGSQRDYAAEAAGY